MDEDHLAGTFGKQVHSGNMRAALCSLSQSTTGQHSRVMKAHDHIDDTRPELGTVLDALKSKHPQGGEVSPDVLLQEEEVDAPIYRPVVFDSITGDSVRAAVLKCGGGWPIWFRCGRMAKNVHCFQR